jgi:anti-sigma regulatory factor (Ser/Thr protein kinase)
MELAAAPPATARAVLEAWSFSETVGLPADVADQLAIVVEELVANVVEHGGAPEDGLIRLRLARRASAVRIELSDPGTPFDPRAAEFHGPNAERGGGAGLALVKAWTTIDSWRFRDGRNELVLRLPCPGD